jgi:hypothetical protein
MNNEPGIGVDALGTVRAHEVSAQVEQASEAAGQ